MQCLFIWKLELNINFLLWLRLLPYKAPWLSKDAGWWMLLVTNKSKRCKVWVARRRSRTFTLKKKNCFLRSPQLSFPFCFVLDMPKKREYVSQLSKNQTRYETHAHHHQCTWNVKCPGFKPWQLLQKWAYFKFCLSWCWWHHGLISKHDTSWMAEWYVEEINANIQPLQNSLKT